MLDSPDLLLASGLLLVDEFLLTQSSDLRLSTAPLEEIKWV